MSNKEASTFLPMKNNIIKWTFVFFILYPGLTLNINCSEPGSDKDAATFDGGTISLEETESAAALQLYELQKNQYQVQYQSLLNILKDKLIAKEAKSLGKSENEVMDAYLNEKYKEPTDEMLQYYYQNSRIRKSFNEVKDDLKNELRERIMESLKYDYTQELMKKYNAKILLKEPKAPSMKVDTEGQKYWGNKDAKVVIIEFSDFECPYCKQMQPEVLKIKAKYEDKIKWVFMDFPLSFHRQAKHAHLAAICSGEQVDYFKVQQKLFSSSPDLSPQTVSKIVKASGVNMEKYNKCMSNPSGKPGEQLRKLESIIKYVVNLGIRSTPSILVNGQYYTGVRSFDSMQKIIEENL